MDKAEAAQFGLTQRDSEQLQRWISARLALVVGRWGRGGSGVVLELKDGSFAVVTAKHVVVRAASTGTVTCVFCGRAGAQSFVPLAIRIHPSRDIAIVYLRPEQRPIAYVPYCEWARCDALPGTQEWLVSSGAPGLLKDPLDEETWTIEKTRILHIFTRYLDENPATGVFRCELDMSDKRLPRRLAGMSGGPIFSSDRRLIGINVEEERQTGGFAYIHALPLKYTKALFDASERPAGPFHDYVGHMEMSTRRVRRKGASTPFLLTTRAQRGMSQSQPTEPHGRIGVIQCITVNGIPLSVAHRFEDPAAKLDDQLHQLQSETFFLLDCFNELEPG